MTQNNKQPFSIFKRKNRSELKTRSKCETVQPVELLEQRLCLGSMHSGLADWGRPVPLTEPAEVRLFNEPSAKLELASKSEFRGAELRNPEIDLATSSPSGNPRLANRSDLPLVTFASRNVTNDGPIKFDRHELAKQTDTKLASALPATLGSGLDSKFDRVLQKLNLAPQDIYPVNSHTDERRETASPISILPGDSTPSTRPARPAVDQVNFTHQKNSEPIRWDSSLLASIGLSTDAQGNAVGYATSNLAKQSGYEAWWLTAEQPVSIKYDFRSIDGHQNKITSEQRQLAVQALEAWSTATNRQITFEQDPEAPDHRIINIGVGDLAAVGHVSGAGAVLGLGGGHVIDNASDRVATGIAWLDHAENWDNAIGNGNPEGTIDFATVVAHEIGHTIGYGDEYGSQNSAMNGTYSGERGLNSIQIAADDGYLYRSVIKPEMATAIEFQPMTTGAPQLSVAEVAQLLRRAAAASASEDGIFAVVDRNGRILGVRVESGALAAIPGVGTLVFAIDGAVAKARTAALFSNGDPTNHTLAPLTSRTVRFLSQSTITQREVESNPNVGNANRADALASTTRGAGFVAPIGVGGHFPPDINFTPLVDLFGIEHTNRDSTLQPGADGIKGTPDDIPIDQRFNIDANFVGPGQTLSAPESYGAAQNSGRLLFAQSRGIATLPGGVPLFRDTVSNADFTGPQDGQGDTLVGGIGVFFPGSDGFASFEQGFVPGIGQTSNERTNAPRVLEAEFIAFAAAGGSMGAEQAGITGAKVGAINGVAPVAHLDIPFGRLDLVGIQLDAVGPMGSRLGTEMAIEAGQSLGVGDPNSGADQVVDGSSGDFYRAGESVPEGWLVTPHDSADGSITAAEVEQIINNGRIAAENVRAAIRLPISNPTRMVLAVTDTNGEVLGLFRMKDATTFSIDVAVAKARNVAYFADASEVQPIDLVGEAGVAYTNRTFRFLAQPRFPSGINGTLPAPFSILHDGNINQLTGENMGAAAPVSAFVDTTPDTTPSVYGYDSFFPNTNFRDPGDGVNPAGSPDAYHTGTDTVANQNGVVFFPGSTPIYKNGNLIGGFGVSGDGVDQDDVVTYVGATGFLPETNGVTRADQTFVRNIRLPYQKFLRNPFGGLC